MVTPGELSRAIDAASVARMHEIKAHNDGDSAVEAEAAEVRRRAEKVVQRLQQQLGTKRSHLVRQRGRGVVRSDGESSPGQNRACVHPCVHLHDGDTGLRVSGKNGCRYRRRTPVAGK